MVNYTSFRSLAERLIEANGRSLTLVRRDQGNPTDSDKPWRDSTEADTVSTTLTGLFVEYEKEDFDGSLIRRGDKKILIAAKSVEDESASSVNVKIEDYDHILDGTVRWKIVAVDLIEPGPSRVMYEIQVRQ